MSSSSSPPPCGLLASADASAGAVSPVAEEGAAEVSSGADSAEAEGVAESLLAVGAGTGAAGAAGAGAGVGAGAWKADMPAPISLRRKFAASASFLSHAKYAWDRRGKTSVRHDGAVCVIELHVMDFLRYSTFVFYVTAQGHKPGAWQEHGCWYDCHTNILFEAKIPELEHGCFPE